MPRSRAASGARPSCWRKDRYGEGRPRLSAALEGTDVEILGFIWYGGQSTHASAARISQDPRVVEADMVFGMGGGRAIDESKEIAELAGKPLFTFPTVASNCAPVTAIGVFYKEDGSVDNYFLPKEPPIHSFIDTKVISESSDDYFWAGIGDALSKQPEVELSSRDLDPSPHAAHGSCARGVVRTSSARLF